MRAAKGVRQRESKGEHGRQEQDDAQPADRDEQCHRRGNRRDDEEDGRCGEHGTGFMAGDAVEAASAQQRSGNTRYALKHAEGQPGLAGAIAMGADQERRCKSIEGGGRKAKRHSTDDQPAKRRGRQQLHACPDKGLRVRPSLGSSRRCRADGQQRENADQASHHAGAHERGAPAEHIVDRPTKAEASHRPDRHAHGKDADRDATMHRAYLAGDQGMAGWHSPGFADRYPKARHGEEHEACSQTAYCRHDAPDEGA